MGPTSCQPKTYWFSNSFADITREGCLKLFDNLTYIQLWFHLHKGAFRNALSLCYGWQPTLHEGAFMDALCPCYGWQPIGFPIPLSVAQEKGASSWLTTLSISEFGFTLHKDAFRAALCPRYGWQPTRLPKKCDCGHQFSKWNMPCPAQWVGSHQ